MLEIAQIAAREWAEKNAGGFASGPEEFGKRVAQVYAACKQALSAPVSPVPSPTPSRAELYKRFVSPEMQPRLREAFEDVFKASLGLPLSAPRETSESSKKDGPAQHSCKPPTPASDAGLGDEPAPVE